MERKFVRKNKRGSKLKFIKKTPNAIGLVSKFKWEKKCKIQRFSDCFF